MLNNRLRHTALAAALPLLLAACQSDELPAPGISYVSLYFDITGLGGEETAAASFLGELLGKVDTADHTAQELSSLIRLHCGSLSFSVDVYERSAERYCAKLTARVSALESSMGKALGLLSEGLPAHGGRRRKRVGQRLRLLLLAQAAGRRYGLHRALGDADRSGRADHRTPRADCQRDGQAQRGGG